jgi:hypothetical protein
MYEDRQHLVDPSQLLSQIKSFTDRNQLLQREINDLTNGPILTDVFRFPSQVHNGEYGDGWLSVVTARSPKKLWNVDVELSCDLEVTPIGLAAPTGSDWISGSSHKIDSKHYKFSETTGWGGADNPLRIPIFSKERRLPTCSVVPQ